jgi:hypothetical protein
MLMCDQHLEHGRNEMIRCGEKQIATDGVNYRVLTLGQGVNIFLTEDQTEELFDKLDKKLHKKTYSDLQDDCFNLDDDLRVSNELVAMYQDN